MTEQFKKFDFSKPEDQKEFNALEAQKKAEVRKGAEEEAAKEGMLKRLSEGSIYSSIRIKDEFKLPEDFVQSAEVQSAAKEGMQKCLSRGYSDYAIRIKDEFKLPEDFVQSAVKEGMQKCLSRGYLSDAIRIKDEFRLPEDFVQLTEVLSAAKEGMQKLLSQGHSDYAIEIKDHFKLPEDFVQSAEVQSAAKEGMLKCFSRGYLSDAIKIKNHFKLPEDFVQSTEVQSAAKEEMLERLSKGYISDAIEIKDHFKLPEDFVKPAAEEGMLKRLSEGYLSDAIQIKDHFKLPEDFFQSVVKEEILKRLSRGDIGSAIRIKDEFKPPEDFVQSAEVQSTAKEVMQKCLSRGDIDYFIKIKDHFKLPEDFVQSSAKEGMLDRLSQGSINSAIEIKDRFNINIPQSILFQELPKLQELVNEIENLAPGFNFQVQKSSDLAIELCRFLNDPDQMIDNVRENPFLIDALTRNSRFSARLLVKYQEFDTLSQENIKKLYSAKEKILAAHLEIDPESLEFRQLIQEELREYKNNPEIVEEIKEQEINLEEWLNYSETSYFNLSTGGSEVAFSEKIHTPIERIKETIDSYAYTLKSVLKEYRPEMEKFEIILEDAKSIADQIAKMEAALNQARTEGNEKKAQGIERGLASQKEKLNNLKKGFLWDKLMGEIAAFQRLKNDCFDAQNRLLEAENKLDEALSGKTPSGKMIQDIKQKITQSKEELRNKFSDLEKRIEDFKTELPGLISPCLSAIRTEALLQEINQKMAEQFNHFDTDRTDLANLFSERGDKETAQLESRPMSIFVWARNPDIDLYQGNYSPCCICIDSAHMGAESTIADYNTDLGVQIVNIWDETKNEPVTAAWCWLGENEKGETALVVDNIESNTLYSLNFSEQLTKELFDYIKEYAQKIGADKVVLGKDNNDLPTGSELARMPEDGNSYEKIGGSNRADGYFLEAEGRSVKSVWERTKKRTEKKPKTEKRIKKIVFNNLTTTIIKENNLSQILQAERKIYAGTGLISGQILTEDIRNNNGFEFSLAMTGLRPGKKSAETVAYIVAVEDETDEGDPSIYLEDIAVLPEAQRQGIGWEMMKELINKLKAKAQRENKPVLLDMHLRETSQNFMARHKEDLERLGVKLIEEALVADYYEEGEDSLYQVYEVR